MEESNKELNNELIVKVQEYIDKKYVSPVCYSLEIPFLSDQELAELEKKKEMNHKNFLDTLFSYIDQKGLTDIEAYKLSNVDRKTFSKIKSGVTKMPFKDTVLSFAFGLGLTIEETDNLLNTAEYSLSNSSKRDIIIRFCLEKKLTLDQVNKVLEYYRLKKLK